jgi:hypothetical protein
VQQNWCVQTLNPLEPADHQWGDNWFCTKPTRNRNIGFLWSRTGPVANMQCLRVFSPNETSWNLTYWCAPLEVMSRAALESGACVGSARLRALCGLPRAF